MTTPTKEDLEKLLVEAISDMNLESQEDISPRGRDAVAFYQSALRGTKGEQDGK